MMRLGAVAGNKGHQEEEDQMEIGRQGLMALEEIDHRQIIK